MFPVLILASLWFACVGQFRSACMGKPGWSEVLFEYHLYGLGLCLMILLSIALPPFVVSETGGPRSFWATGAGLAVLISGLASVVVLAPRARRRCKAKMDLLQRDVAVKLAAEHLRKRLSRPHS